MISNDLIMNEKIVLRIWLIEVVRAFLPALSDDSIAIDTICGYSKSAKQSEDDWDDAENSGIDSVDFYEETL